MKEKLFCLEKNVVYIIMVAQVPNIAIRIKTTIVIALSTALIVSPSDMKQFQKFEGIVKKS